MPCPIKWYFSFPLFIVSSISEWIVSMLHASSNSCWKDQRFIGLFFTNLLVRGWLKQWRVGCKSIHRIVDRLIIDAISISMLAHLGDSHTVLHFDVSNDTYKDVIQAPSPLICIAPIVIFDSKCLMSFCSDLSAVWYSFSANKYAVCVIFLEVIDAR